MSDRRFVVKGLERIIATGLCLSFLTACTVPEVIRSKDSPSRIRTEKGSAKTPRACCTTKPKTTMQQALANTAVRFIGAKRILAKGKRFRYDCSGLASAVYFTHGINLFNTKHHSPTDNGVRRIHRYVSQHGRLHQGPTTQPGDLVFFHNTYDANRDGRLNDRLTHVGIVEKVRSDGTVIFVSRVSRGIERYRMNLSAFNQHKNKKGHVLNDFLRRKRGDDRKETKYLTGELFATFGTVTH